MSQPAKKTSTITFRLDDEIVKKLRTESGNRQVSTNTLVNQALRRFLEWDVFEPVSGFVMINKLVFSQIFGKMKQDAVIDIASRVGKNEVRDIALFMKGNLDLLSFLSWFKMRMINSSVQVSHTHQDGFHTFIMKHDIGKNWSIYHKTILELLFHEVFNRKIPVKAEKNT
ncbi:MAG: CopG family ribbon-helix-helix protein, partial [Candidatus Dormibacteria bacterium]